MKVFRNNGAIGALLDEYEKAIIELKEILKTVSDHDLQQIVDPLTKDEDCRSIQSILTHVIRSAFGYVIYIRNWQGEHLEFPNRIKLNSIDEYVKALDDAFAFNVKLFEDYPNINMEENDHAKKIMTNWGQAFDVDQMMEHAIVHILRHRRQIERFLLVLSA